MKATINFECDGYGIGMNWYLVLTNKAGESRSLFLGQDVKFCKRVLGMDPGYIIEQIGDSDLRKDGVRVKLANFILKSLGIKKSEAFTLEGWALSAQ